MSSTTTKVIKQLKWTKQRVNMRHKRVTKRTAPPPRITKVKSKKPPTELERLESDLAFTYDALATIYVHYDSLKHAYTEFKPTLDESSNPLQLCDMERELLTAYDDLGLQVKQFERKLIKLEKRLSELRSGKQQEQQLLPEPPMPQQRPARLERIDTSSFKYQTPELTPSEIELSPCSSISTMTDFLPPPIPLMANVEETVSQELAFEPIAKYHYQQQQSNPILPFIFDNECSSNTMPTPPSPLTPLSYFPTHYPMSDFLYTFPQQQQQEELPQQSCYATWSSSYSL
ncbi:hypothetical protein EC973_004829 [Apophysomyces ossiformis]|uniref:Uncharacterized protein n=1 Tax=Apophysomyces ossiformis TaxID=679940 RepID=A0A8H7BJS8_9FUNG|nr:hypothetical protein EC973_004829 [Apophysomyces ossiformis]